MTSRTSDKRKTAVAFPGERGAFSELAAHTYFGLRVRTLPLRSFDDVFQKVSRSHAMVGIIPIENSLLGSIHENYDLLQTYSLKIIGEIKLRVVHSLLVNRQVTMKNVRYVYSHPQALGQCEAFFRKHKSIEAVAMYDTAGAAKYIKEEHRTDAAAIASADAARVYGLQVLRSGIESNRQNYTRFLILSNRNRTTEGKTKTSIIFSLKNISGALHKALSVFALRNINLHKIESRPLIGKPWQYMFYLDFEGNVRNEVSRRAIENLREMTLYLKILGSYPEGKTIVSKR